MSAWLEVEFTSVTQFFSGCDFPSHMFFPLSTNKTAPNKQPPTETFWGIKELPNLNGTPKPNQKAQQPFVGVVWHRATKKLNHSCNRGPRFIVVTDRTAPHLLSISCKLQRSCQRRGLCGQRVAVPAAHNSMAEHTERTRPMGAQRGRSELLLQGTGRVCPGSSGRSARQRQQTQEQKPYLVTLFSDPSWWRGKPHALFSTAEWPSLFGQTWWRGNSHALVSTTVWPSLFYHSFGSWLFWLCF